MEQALLIIDVQQEYFPGGKLELIEPLFFCPERQE